MTAMFCAWGKHKVDIDAMVGASLHGRDACRGCWQDHDESCCSRCRRVGLCPVHGRDLAACKDVIEGGQRDKNRRNENE
jgi:hypothetical protein